jgi:hypothetical protein
VSALGNEDGGESAGQVRVYQWNGDDWVRKGLNFNGSALEVLGWSLGLSGDGNLLAIGSYNQDWWDESNRGSVKIYRWSNNEWVKEGNTINGAEFFDGTGYSLSLNEDGTAVAIGLHMINAGKVQVYASSTVSAIEEEHAPEFLVFPNPASTSITILSEPDEKGISITFRNLVGEVISTHRGVPGQNSHTISVEQIPSGMYILEIVQGGGQSTHKVIIH